MKNINNVIIWAQNKNLITKGNAPKQLTKVIEELGETADAFVKRDSNKVIDGIGDVFVTLIILAKQLDCENQIYNGLNKPNIELKTPHSYLFRLSGCISSLGELIECNNEMFTGYHIHEAINLIKSFAENIGKDHEYCFNSAYNEIKGREGKTVDGIFIKN